METMARRRRRARPAGGTLTAFEPPSGPGVRVDTLGYAGYTHEPALRLAARQDRSCTRRRPSFADAVGARVPRARRVPHRGRADQRSRFLQRLLRPSGRRRPTASTRASSSDHAAELRRGRAASIRALYLRRRTGRRTRPARRRARRPARSARRARRTARSAQRAATLAAPATTHERRRRRSRCARPLQGTIVSVDVARRRRGARRAAAARDGSDEDGARGRRAERGGIVRRLARGGRATRSSRGTLLAFIEAADVAGRASADGAPRSTSTTSAPISPRCSSATPSASTRRGPRRSRAGARPASARRARTSTTSATRARFVEYGAARDRRAAPPPLARGPDREDAGRRAGRRHRPRQRRRCSATRASRCVVLVLRLHRARRHAGRAEPPQEGPHVRARRAAAPAGRASSPRAAAAGPATPTRSASPASTAWRSTLFGAAVRAGAAGRHQLRALLRRQRRAARLLRRRHRDRRTRTSAWAARR